MRIVPLGIVVDCDKVLLVHRRFHPVLWGPPGGFTEVNETLQETVVREVLEETGINCEVVSKIHEFDAYDTHMIVFACRYLSGSLRCSYESTDLGWFEINRLPKPLSPDQSVFEAAVKIANKN